MDWFLYDNGLRHERVKSLKKAFLNKYKRILLLHYVSNADFPINQKSVQKEALTLQCYQVGTLPMMLSWEFSKFFRDNGFYEKF